MKIRDRIVELIEKETYSVTEICKAVNISRKTYYGWLNNFPDFSNAIAEARKRCDESILIEARHALHLKLNGYKSACTTYKYVSDDFGELILKEKTVKVRDCPPDFRTIQSVLERCGENMSRKPVSVVKDRPIILTVSSDDERLHYQPVADEFVKQLNGHVSENDRCKDKKHIGGNGLENKKV